MLTTLQILLKIEMTIDYGDRFDSQMVLISLRNSIMYALKRYMYEMQMQDILNAPGYWLCIV